jgi:teichuronic acid biosynthesis glycosyltransferase TuaC
MPTVKVLSLSTLFPNEAQPRHGIFTLHRLAHLAHVADIEVRMVAPVPWFPSGRPMFGEYVAYANALGQASSAVSRCCIPVTRRCRKSA